METQPDRRMPSINDYSEPLLITSSELSGYKSFHPSSYNFVKAILEAQGCVKRIPKIHEGAVSVTYSFTSRSNSILIKNECSSPSK